MSKFNIISNEEIMAGAQIVGRNEEVESADFRESYDIIVDFIHEVEGRPCLWDTGIPQYHDRNKIARAWEELTTQFPGLGDLRKKWRYIRTAFVRNRKGSNLPSGSAAKQTNKYKYAEELSFLNDVVSPRETSCTLSPMNKRAREDKSKRDAAGDLDDELASLDEQIKSVVSALAEPQPKGQNEHFGMYVASRLNSFPTGNVSRAQMAIMEVLSSIESE